MIFQMQLNDGNLILMNSDKYIIKLYPRDEQDFTIWYVANLTKTDKIVFSCFAPTPMPLDIALKMREKLINSMINDKMFYFKSAAIVPFDGYKDSFEYLMNLYGTMAIGTDDIESND